MRVPVVVHHFTQICREKVASVLASALALTALMVLRPAREALGMQRGIGTIRSLFMGTAGARPYRQRHRPVAGK